MLVDNTFRRLLPQLVVIAGIFLLTSSCASMDQGQCVTADWYDVGYEDGRRGESKNTISNYSNDCAEYGVSVDTGAYKDGWNDGIPQYCTSGNGYRVGINGEYYDDTCPGHLKDRFYIAYLLGSAVHSAQIRVDNLRNEIEELGDQASRSGVSDDRRKELRRDRKRLKNDLDEARIDLIAAEIRASENGF